MRQVQVRQARVRQVQVRQARVRQVQVRQLQVRLVQVPPVMLAAFASICWQPPLLRVDPPWLYSSLAQCVQAIWVPVTWKEAPFGMVYGTTAGTPAAGGRRGDQMKVYLAGPDVFLPDAVAIGQRKKALCAQYGFEGLFPFDNEVSPNAAGERIDKLIYRANEQMIRRADLGICNLTPFRGPSADVGTVFELGLMVGLGKRVFGYTNVTDDLLQRCKDADPAVSFDPVAEVWRDANRMTIENFGNADNLMIDNALAEHGSYQIVRYRAPPDHLFADLTGFEMCLRQVAQWAREIDPRERSGAAGKDDGFRGSA